MTFECDGCKCNMCKYKNKCNTCNQCGWNEDGDPSFQQNYDCEQFEHEMN